MSGTRSTIKAAVRHSLAGQHAFAIACFQAVLSEHSGLTAKDLMEAALAFDRAGQEQKAIPLYIKALSGKLSDNQRVNGYICLASSYRTVGDRAAARHILHKAMGPFPNEAMLSILLAILDHDEGKSASAVSRLLTVCSEHIRGANISSYLQFLRQEARRVVQTRAG
jgi:hypothetical protein